MKKLLILIAIFLTTPFCSAAENNLNILNFLNDDTRLVKSVLKSQVRYANREDFRRFISTYDKDYKNADGFTLDMYANLVKDIWNSYDKIKYGIKINDIVIDGDTAVVKLVETSSTSIPSSNNMDGILKSSSNSIYYLQKKNGKWKVISDAVVDESTSMMYGMAKNLDIKLIAPKEVYENEEYSASLEFDVPQGVMAIASIANEKIEYPQKQVKEVFRKMPDDNILERLFKANTEKKNEYVIASIGLTKADVCDLSIKISLAGFGYQIVRVNVIEAKKEEVNDKTE